MARRRAAGSPSWPTRFVTPAIRAGRGPFRDASVGGVHLHHEVYGIFLLLIVGTAEFTYRPARAGRYVLAALFGVGAGLTLDEFALWLHLEDVYSTSEGRSSVDAVMIALLVGGLLIVGATPFDTDAAGGEAAVAATVVVNLVFALVSILKGRVVLGVTRVFVPVLALVGALCGWPGRGRRGHAGGTPPGRRSDAGPRNGSPPGGGPAGTPSSTCSTRSPRPRPHRAHAKA